MGRRAPCECAHTRWSACTRGATFFNPPRRCPRELSAAARNVDPQEPAGHSCPAPATHPSLLQQEGPMRLALRPIGRVAPNPA